MKKITIYSLADELNMTPSMVSRAFNPNAKIAKDKRALVLDTAAKYGFVPNKFASRLSMKTIKIGILLYYKAEHLKEEMVLGIKDSYNNLKDYKIEYTLKCISAQEKKPSECEQDLLSFSKFDGVILSGFSSNICKPMLECFYEKNPNIVFLQSICEDTNYLFASKHDEILASELAAEILANRLFHSERKNILLFTGDQTSSVHDRAKKAFFKAAGEHSLNILDCIDMQDRESVLAKLSEDVLEKHKNQFDGIYITSGNCISLCETVRRKNISTSLVTFDIFSRLYSYIEDNTICASIFQNVRAQASTAFLTLCNHIINNNGVEKIIYTPVSPIFKSTLKLYK